MVFNSLSVSYLLFSALHLSLLILAAITAGLYGVDLRAGGASDGNWVFAVVVACLSALSAVLFLIPFVLRFMAVWVWDLVLFILWIAVFGVFGMVCFPFPLITTPSIETRSGGGVEVGGGGVKVGDMRLEANIIQRYIHAPMEGTTTRRM
ncbi:hypothetical protein IMZ48_35190, partial [Candidatus Bathyarchaeota archaeon]|nr:hypothetical protein [Candidatus Bathyarchaeota archaeon]